MTASHLSPAERALRRLILGGGDAGLFTFYGPSRHAAPLGGPVRPAQPRKSQAQGAKAAAHAQIDRARLR